MTMQHVVPGKILIALTQEIRVDCALLAMNIEKVIRIILENKHLIKCLLLIEGSWSEWSSTSRDYTSTYHPDPASIPKGDCLTAS